MGTTWRSSDEIKWAVWGAEGMKCGHPQAQVGVVHREHTTVMLVISIRWCAKFLGCHKHLLPFCLISPAVSVLSDLNYLILKTHRRESYLSFLPLIHYTLPSHPPYIRWRIFGSLFATCLLHRLRVRCCQVYKKNVNTCHLLFTSASSSSGF